MISCLKNIFLRWFKWCQFFKKKFDVICIDSTYANFVGEEFPNRRSSAKEAANLLRMLKFNGADSVAIPVPAIGYESFLINISRELKVSFINCHDLSRYMRLIFLSNVDCFAYISLLIVLIHKKKAWSILGCKQPRIEMQNQICTSNLVIPHKSGLYITRNDRSLYLL